MATDTDVRIARAVALKAAIDLVNGRGILLDQVDEYVEKYAALLLMNGVERGQVQSGAGGGDPGPTPPDEWPQDKESYDNNPPAFVPPPQGPVGQANPVCLCGAEKPWNSQHQGWFCPNQKKSRDPAVQAAQKLEHPPSWP